jgi:hypothetical protein
MTGDESQLLFAFRHDELHRGPCEPMRRYT